MPNSLQSMVVCGRHVVAIDYVLIVFREREWPLCLPPRTYPDPKSEASHIGRIERMSQQSTSHNRTCNERRASRILDGIRWWWCGIARRKSELQHLNHQVQANIQACPIPVNARVGFTTPSINSFQNIDDRIYMQLYIKEMTGVKITERPERSRYQRPYRGLAQWDTIYLSLALARIQTPRSWSFIISQTQPHRTLTILPQLADRAPSRSY